MILTFRHKGLHVFFETGSKAGIQAHHAARLQLQLTALKRAQQPADMDIPSWRLHQLRGNLDGHWAIWVDKNWRLTFRFVGEDVELLDYQDYH